MKPKYIVSGNNNLLPNKYIIRNSSYYICSEFGDKHWWGLPDDNQFLYVATNNHKFETLYKLKVPRMDDLNDYFWDICSVVKCFSPDIKKRNFFNYRDFEYKKI